MTTPTSAMLAPEVDAPERPLLPSSPYTAPQVNLLPPEVGERKSLHRLQAALVAGVIACGAVVGGLYVLSDSGRASAQSKVDQAVSDGSVLQSAKTRLLPVQIARSQVQATKQSLVSAMSAEVLWSHYLDQVRLRLPDGVRLTSLTVTPSAVTAPVASATGKAGTASSAAPAPTPVPATGAAGAASPAALPTTGTIASVTIAGKAVDHDAVASWLDALDKIPAWSGAYLTSTTADAKGLVTFTATSNIGSAALSHRYTDGS